MNTRKRCASVAPVTLLALVALPALAGDLDPPAGPVGQTMLPLDHVEPRTPLDPADLPLVINASGSYVLTGNLLASGFGTDAITINADDVTLDLRGFVISNTEVGLFDAGIEIAQGVSNVSISNGTIRGCDQDGVSAFNVDDCVFTDLRIVSCGGQGISISGESTILRCAVRSNGSTGILVNGNNAVVRDCFAELNGGGGISVGANSAVTNCVSDENGQSIPGSGFLLGDGSTALNCTASGNMSFGFFSSGGNVALRNCTSVGNQSTGFATSLGCVLEGCIAESNLFEGFNVSASVLRDCLARDNGRDGYEVNSDSVITGSSAVSNDQAGFNVIGSDNRIDANTATDNTLGGINVSGSGNLVVRNAASGNVPDFSIAGGNDAGTVVLTPVGSGAWDNFGY